MLRLARSERAFVEVFITDLGHQALDFERFEIDQFDRRDDLVSSSNTRSPCFPRRRPRFPPGPREKRYPAGRQGARYGPLSACLLLSSTASCSTSSISRRPKTFLRWTFGTLPLRKPLDLHVVLDQVIKALLAPRIKVGRPAGRSEFHASDRLNSFRLLALIPTRSWLLSSEFARRVTGSADHSPHILWCGRRDLNPHGRSHQNLNLACLPVPPRPPKAKSMNRRALAAPNHAAPAQMPCTITRRSGKQNSRSTARCAAGQSVCKNIVYICRKAPKSMQKISRPRPDYAAI